MNKESWILALDRATEKYQRAFGDLSIEELNWKPSENQWSVGQCIHHIVTTNRQYFPIFTQILEGTYRVPFIGRIPGMPALFGNMIYKSLHESRKKKYKTFPVFEPTNSNVPLSVLNKLVDNQKELKGFIEKLDERQLRQVMASPVSNVVVYRVSKALDIICTHELRHFKQAEEVNTTRLASRNLA